MEGWTIEDRELGGRRELVLAGARLRLRLDPSRPEIELWIAGVPAPLRLAPRLDLAGAPPEVRPGTRRSLALGELRALAGPAWRLEVQSVGASRVGLRWTLELPRSGDGVVLSLALENRSAGPLRVAALVPAALAGERRGAILLPPVARAWPLAARGDLLAPFASRDPAPRDGRLHCAESGPLLLRGRAAPWLLAGFSTAARSSTQISVEASDGGLRALELRCSAGARRLAPGESLESERAWLAFGDPPGALLAEWARRCGLEAGAPPRRPLVLVRAARAPGREEAQALRELGVAAVERPGTRAPGGRPHPRPERALASFARGVRARGLLPALRLDLGPRARGPALARPERLAALRSWLAELAGLGVGAFTLQGLGDAAASRPPGPLRDLLAELRAAAGPEAWLLPPAGAPPLEGLGRLDALALADRPRRGGPLVTDLCRRLGGPARAGLADAAGRSRLLQRCALAARAGLADPGELDLGAGSLAAAEARLSLAGLLGGVLRLRGDPSRLEPARLAALRRALPLLALPGLAADLEAAGGPRSLMVPLLGGRLAVLLLAPEGPPTLLGVELRSLGATGPHHVFDFWPGRYLGVAEERVAATRVPGGGCRLLGLTPLAARPQLVGSTLHLGMGTLEGFALEEGPGAALRLELRLPGEREGELWIAPAGSRSARRLTVRFRDAGSFDLPPAAR